MLSRRTIRSDRIVRTTRKYRAVALAITLAGCATTRSAPRVEYVEVKTPVPVYCVTADQIPAEPALVHDQLTGHAGEDIGPIAASAVELRKALRLALALLSGCVKPA